MSASGAGEINSKRTQKPVSDALIRPGGNFFAPNQSPYCLCRNSITIG